MAEQRTVFGIPVKPYYFGPTDQDKGRTAVDQDIETTVDTVTDEPNLYDHKTLQEIAAKHRASFVDDTAVEISRVCMALWALTLNVNWLAQTLADPTDGLPGLGQTLRGIAHSLQEGHLG